MFKKYKIERIDAQKEISQHDEGCFQEEFPCNIRIHFLHQIMNLWIGLINVKRCKANKRDKCQNYRMNQNNSKGLHEQLDLSDFKTFLKMVNNHLNKKNIIQII